MERVLAFCMRLGLKNDLFCGQVTCPVCGKRIWEGELKTLSGGFIRHSDCHYDYARKLGERHDV